MVRVAAFVALLTFTIASRLALAQQPKTFVSRDGKLTAIVVPVGKEFGRKDYESRVELHSNTRHVLAKRDYSSEDSQHGYGVVKGDWTPDSRFFVYSLASSGGHQAWHSEVQVYSRKLNKFFSLDEALGDTIMQYEISAPDKVTVELYIAKEKLTVSLAALVAKKQK